MTRDDFDRVEMEQYFNYSGRLAVEQTYDTFDKYLDQGMHPVDVILLWACEEGDGPKVEEVLNAGAHINVKDLNGKTPMELATADDVKDLLQQAERAGATA
jgi:ankyrin repeat protein